MEPCLYFSVKALCAAYLFYRLWIALFKEKLYGLWKDIFPKKKEKSVVPLPVPVNDGTEVIGKTHIVYLDDPQAAVTPVRSEKLELLSDFIGEDEDISPDDVEFNIVPKTPEDILEELERFEPMDDYDPGVEEDFSTGLTFERMANAVEVLTENGNGDDTKVIEAARTIYNIRQTDLFQFFTTQISNFEQVENLLKECLDGEGNPLPVRRSKLDRAELDSFSWDKFV